VSALVVIDIKPGAYPNSINPDSRGVIPAAILTIDTFDATTVDPFSVRFGPSGASVDMRGGDKLKAAIKDVDHDGCLDLIMGFRTQDTNIEPGDTEACLEGTTHDGMPVWGCDSVRTVPPDADADGDSEGLGLPRVFGDDIEASLRTDQQDACPDDPSDTAWPPDFDNDGTVTIFDITRFQGCVPSMLGDAEYNNRLDLRFDGENDILDPLAMRPFVGKSCAEAHVDTDGDGIADLLDDDDDNDGFTDAVELGVGTDPLLFCGVDAWPPDFNNDATVNVIDIIAFRGSVMSTAGEARYTARFDLNIDDRIDIIDVLAMRPFIMRSCA